MKAAGWKRKILDACEAAGTYRPFFDAPIQALADILAQRDEVMKLYRDSGEPPVTEYTNKGGATNAVTNPKLVLWDKLNATALTYWKELGLTPAGLKKITNRVKDDNKPDGLALALRKLEAG